MDNLSNSSPINRIQPSGSICETLCYYKKTIFVIILLIVICVFGYYLWKKYRTPSGSTNPSKKNIIKNEENFSIEDNLVENFENNNLVEDNLIDNNLADNFEDNNSIDLDEDN